MQKFCKHCVALLQNCIIPIIFDHVNHFRRSDAANRISTVIPCKKEQKQQQCHKKAELSPRAPSLWLLSVKGSPASAPVSKELRTCETYALRRST